MKIFMYINNIFYPKSYLNQGCVVKVLKIHLYNRPTVADRRRFMLIMVPGCMNIFIRFISQSNQ